jgi:SAM-dependent methyltransferase
MSSSSSSVEEQFSEETESAPRGREGAAAPGAEPYRWVEQHCPVCGRTPTQLLGRRGGAAHREGAGVECRVWRCRGCDLVFPNPMPVPSGGLEQHYGVPPDEYFENHDQDAKGRAAASLLERARELVGGRAGRLLDVGSGRGELLLAAREAGWEAVGLDPSPAFARHAARHSGAEVRERPIERCGFESGSFDVVIFAAVLEHVYNPDETVAEIARVLRRGGALFVDVPNERGLYFRAGNLYQRLRGRDWVVNLAPTFDPYHLFGFSPRALRALLAKHGLRPVDWRVYGGTSMVPARGGLAGRLEQLAARAVTAVSNRGELGTYIETWAVKE